MEQEKEAEKIIRELAHNSAVLKSMINEGNLPGAIKLTGQRIALVEALRELRDAKVSLANSDVLDEMTMLIKSSQNDVNETTALIRSRLSELSRELANLKGARKIAAYAAMRGPAIHGSETNERDKKQGGRYGY